MENNVIKHSEYTKTPVGEEKLAGSRRTQSEETQHTPTEREVYSRCDLSFQIIVKLLIF